MNDDYLRKLLTDNFDVHAAEDCIAVCRELMDVLGIPY